MNTINDILGKWFHRLRGELPQLFVVGGAVRDHLLGKSVSDLDIVCENPGAFAAALAGFGNATVVPFLKNKDLPCFRVVDRENQSDHIDITSIYKGGILTDLSRRDFTVNAMAIPILFDGKLGEIVDPLNGMRDLEKKKIRLTGEKALNDDPVRVLRAVRFSAMLDFAICRRTLTEMTAASAGLNEMAGERIWAELEKILSRPVCGKHIRLLDSVGALPVIFPEIDPMKGCRQNAWHHLDVWNHSLAVLDECEAVLGSPEMLFGDHTKDGATYLNAGDRLVFLKLAALLHDVGKPDARTVDKESGNITFHGHDRTGAERIESIGERLKWSNRQKTFLQTLISRHMSVLFLSRPDVKRKTCLKWFRKLGEDMIAAMLLSLADARAAKGPDADPEFVKRHERWVSDTLSEYFRELRQTLSEPPLINGEDVLAMGVHVGPEVGRILLLVREAQDEGRIRCRDDALSLAKRIISDHIRKNFR